MSFIIHPTYDITWKCNEGSSIENRHLIEGIPESRVIPFIAALWDSASRPEKITVEKRQHPAELANTQVVRDRRPLQIQAE